MTEDNGMDPSPPLHAELLGMKAREPPKVLDNRTRAVLQRLADVMRRDPREASSLLGVIDAAVMDSQRVDATDAEVLVCEQVMVEAVRLLAR